MLHHALEMAGDTYFIDCEICMDPDFIISFGHRHIIPPITIDKYKDKLINIHISLLPWNRGADPNFWSWFDDTPKGVTIHRIDAGIDTGNILVQEEVTKWHKGETLHSSWHHLMGRAKALFEDSWKNIRRDGLASRKAEGNGSYHRSADKSQWFEQLPLGWQTPVKDIKRLGREYRKSIEVPEANENRGSRPRKYRQQTFKEL